MTQRILFYLRESTYGWLSNFERAQQVIDGKTYPTNEHYYQSRRAATPEIAEWIRLAPHPWLAMKAGRLLKERGWERDDWERGIRVAIMLDGLKAKFSQNPHLRDRLLDTGDALLHEDSPTDKFWGVLGEDRLGQLLMQVRDELRRGVKWP